MPDPFIEKSGAVAGFILFSSLKPGRLSSGIDRTQIYPTYEFTLSLPVGTAVIQCPLPDREVPVQLVYEGF